LEPTTPPFFLYQSRKYPSFSKEVIDRCIHFWIWGASGNSDKKLLLAEFYDLELEYRQTTPLAHRNTFFQMMEVPHQQASFL